MSEGPDEELPIGESSADNDKIDALISGLFVVASIVLFVESATFADVKVGSRDPGAAFWPRAVLLVIILFSSLNIAFIAWRNKETWRLTLPTTSIRAVRDAVSPGQTTPETKQFVATIALTVAYLSVLTDLGFLIATPIFLFLFLWTLEYRSIGLTTTLSVVASILIFILFRNIMNIALPFGSGIFRQVGVFVDGLL